MGQYFKIVNKTKKEVVRPGVFGSGIKLWEITANGKGSLQGLALLIAEGHNQVHPCDIIGRWSGDEITLVGDYAESGLYQESGKYKDITIDVYRVLCKEEWIGYQVRERLKKYGSKYLIQEELELMQELFPLEVHEGDLRQKYDFVEKEVEHGL